MIIFQATPCRLYPKILTLIESQFEDVTHVHEVFSLKKGISHNPLDISPNNISFGRCNFICGIFQSRKIRKKDGDFWFTIKTPQDKVLEEFYCAIKYFSSTEFVQTNPSKDYALNLCQVLEPLNKLTQTDFFKILKKNDANKVLNNEFYNFNEELEPNHKNFDYIGDFDNRGRTISDLKDLISLDLSILQNQSPYSYKK